MNNTPRSPGNSPQIAAEGQRSPAFELPEARGGVYGLADALAGGSHALLVFLRHYG